MNTHPAPAFDAWAWLQAWNETWAAGLVPATAQRLREQRLAALLERACRDSPLYRRRQHGTRLADFAPVEKAELMLHFDDWATDRRITRAAAAAFIADTDCIADAWLGQYLLWTSSGTSGVPGWFVQDAQSLAAYDAIDALRLRGSASIQASLGHWGLGQRFAFVGASGGHFAGLVSMQRLRRIVPPPWQPEIHILSAQQPLRRIADELQALRPTVLITYPSCAAALAQWQQAGTLGLRLSELWLGGEQLSAAQRRQIQAAFGCSLRNNYGASEFYSIARECAQGCLHVNDDWVILEPVDAQGRPVPDGTLSHATLLTNLANRTQPLIRYRLDDRIRRLPTACRCGSAFTAIEVQGRSADTLTLRGARHRAVTILPLALETAIEEAAQVTQFQVIGRGNGELELRLEPAVPDARAAFGRCREAIDAFLAEHGVAHTRVRFSRAAPLHGRFSGKLRRVISA
ncbi:MAG: phenylacetate--CoA ligase family protein [Burkholderiaceae bacterium]|nr:phenylacetate--CoA ligase family protein [Burkholderiaceae bacterium]